jgi:hypothetical protein
MTAAVRADAKAAIRMSTSSTAPSGLGLPAVAALAACWRPILTAWIQTKISCAWTVPRPHQRSGAPPLIGAVESTTATGFVVRTRGGWATFFTYIDLAIGACVPRDPTLQDALRRAGASLVTLPGSADAETAALTVLRAGAQAPENVPPG